MTVVKATVTHTLNTSMFPQKLPQNSSFAMANARFSDDSDLQQYWMSICAREREAKSRNARILRELESLERRFNVMEIRTKKIVELKDWYVTHLQRKNPNWKPDLITKSQPESLFTEPGGILSKLSTFKHLESLTGPYAITLENEGSKPMDTLKTDIEMLRERLDRMATNSSIDKPIERLTIESIKLPEIESPKKDPIQPVFQSQMTSADFQPVTATSRFNETVQIPPKPKSPEVPPTTDKTAVSMPEPLVMPKEKTEEVHAKIAPPRINFTSNPSKPQETHSSSSSSSESSHFEEKMQSSPVRKITSSSINEYQRVENSDSSEPGSELDAKPRAPLGYASLLGIVSKITAADNISLNSEVDELDRQITSKPPETRKASAFQPIFDSAKPTESRATELTRKASIVPARIPVDKKDEKEDLLSQLFPQKPTQSSSPFNLKLIGGKADSDSDVEIPIAKKGFKANVESDDDDFFN